MKPDIQTHRPTSIPTSRTSGQLKHALLAVALATAPAAATAETSGNLFPEGSFDQPLELLTEHPNPATKDPLNALEGVMYAEPANFAGRGCTIEQLTEDGVSFLRLSAPESFTGILRVYIPLRLPEPTPAFVTLNVRWRISELQPNPDPPAWASVQADPIFVLASGETKVINNTLRSSESTNGEFIEIEKTVPVPDGAVMLILQPGLYCVTGTLDIDQIQVIAE